MGKENKFNEKNETKNTILKVFHGVAAIQFIFGVYYFFAYIHFPQETKMSNNFGGKFKYLTVLDAVSFQTKMFIIIGKSIPIIDLIDTFG